MLSLPAITSPVTIVAISCLALVYAASFSSGVYDEYIYDYEVQIASGLSGFRFGAKASLDILYVAKGTATTSDSSPNEIQNHRSQRAESSAPDSLLVRLRLSDPVFYSGPADDKGQPLSIAPKYNKLYNPTRHLYARIETLANGTAIVRDIFTHQADATTFKNIKKSILLNILPTSHHLITPQHNQQPHKQQEALLEYISLKPLCVHEHDNSREQPELFSPDSISQTNILAKARNSNSPESTTASAAGLINLPVVFQSVDGQQNVTFRSRVFAQAESNLTTKFSLNLVNQVKSNAHEKFDQADSVEAAMMLLEDKKSYQPDSIQLERERRTCSSHHCDRSLEQLFDDYEKWLSQDSMASVEAAVAYLRILDRLRASPGTSVKDILALLKAHRQPDVQSSLLDILAAARTKNSIQAALKFIKLPKNKNLDVAERFLSVLSVAAKTAAKMHLKRPLQSPYYFTPVGPLRSSAEAKAQRAQIASLEFIAREFLATLETVPAQKWSSEKMRWSSLLTLATLIDAYNQEHHYQSLDDHLNLKVEELLLAELAACHADDVDCRVVAMQAIGNAGRLGLAQFAALRRQVLSFGGRESNAAMKVLRDLLQNQPKGRTLVSGFYEKFEQFLLEVVYDRSRETTSRVLASEMIVRFVPNWLVSEELLNELPSFGNNELATMIYSRVLSLRPHSRLRQHENWYWKSCIINGTSTSFVKTMARTDSLNASYGVNVELSDKGKMFKESSFDVLLDTKERTQDLFSLGIFARGLSKMSSSEGADSAAESETMMAGMSLKLLGGYLRPYIFFTGYSELVGHIWSGTASEPTTAFNGDLLLIDHDEAYPLISGFVAEQQMRGVLSIDVSGQVKVSIWNRNSHSVVTTKAAIIVQASQSVFSSYENLWFSQLFSFGGQALIDFKADANFHSMPVQTCLQVSQPEFFVRYNSRRHEQMMGAQVSRKLTRRNYKIGAKSYSLNSENNKMCAAMIDEL